MEDQLNKTNVPPTNESNPLAANLKVWLSLPEALSIEMVEASQLSNYELWTFVSSLLMNLCVGFVVAAATNTVPERRVVLWLISVIFGLLLVGSIVLMFSFRKKISKAKTTIPMKAVQDK